MASSPGVRIGTPGAGRAVATAPTVTAVRAIRVGTTGTPQPPVTGTAAIRPRPVTTEATATGTTATWIRLTTAACIAAAACTGPSDQATTRAGAVPMSIDGRNSPRTAMPTSRPVTSTLRSSRVARQAGTAGRHRRTRTAGGARQMVATT